MFNFLKREDSRREKSKILWLDLGDLGDLVSPSGPHEQWQDHGLGLLRTIMHQNGIMTDILSTRLITEWPQLEKQLPGYEKMLMNVRSYTFPVARKAAQIFKQINPNGIVLTGGMHATVAVDEMLEVPEFDHICKGPGEKIIVDLVKDPQAYPRVIEGEGARSMADWPMIDRTLWPQPHRRLRRNFNWPLEPACGWGPPPVATMLTSRVCPWQCVFCNESSYIPHMGRKPVDMTIDELNTLDNQYGVGSVVIHDSMFFQNPAWLKEWLEKYPRKANKLWPYWAAGRSDTVRQWPDLFEALVRETNWDLISIGFESGSDRILRLLNKECTEEDNYLTIDLVNKLGAEFERKGRKPPRLWANIILGIPGETPEDAFKTMRMVKSMHYVLPSFSYYAPYPGSALGYQLIAEGKSLMSKENYHRFPGDEKVKGVDYQFYRNLLAGKYDDKVNRGLSPLDRQKPGVYTEALTKA
ncbi:MAG: B12-binding domain-containing radical SAM protein [Anaerolineae bacterium]|nr:B12-binding domain-containing radical SAM protein [Anaerolineae bacterium]